MFVLRDVRISLAHHTGVVVDPILKSLMISNELDRDKIIL